MYNNILLILINLCVLAVLWLQNKHLNELEEKCSTLVSGIVLLYSMMTNSEENTDETTASND